MDPLSLISVDPQIAHGQACIKGTRIPVSVVLDCVAAGMTDAEIMVEYPMLSVDAIRAAASYDPDALPFAQKTHQQAL